MIVCTTGKPMEVQNSQQYKNNWWIHFFYNYEIQFFNSKKKHYKRVQLSSAGTMAAVVTIPNKSTDIKDTASL
jgi:hypothetical protein